MFAKVLHYFVKNRHLTKRNHVKCFLRLLPLSMCVYVFFRLKFYVLKHTRYTLGLPTLSSGTAHQEQNYTPYTFTDFHFRAPLDWPSGLNAHSMWLECIREFSLVFVWEENCSYSHCTTMQIKAPWARTTGRFTLKVHSWSELKISTEF